jgi:hypothetical protein
MSPGGVTAGLSDLAQVIASAPERQAAIQRQRDMDAREAARLQQAQRDQTIQEIQLGGGYSGEDAGLTGIYTQRQGELADAKAQRARAAEVAAYEVSQRPKLEEAREHEIAARAAANGTSNPPGVRPEIAALYENQADLVRRRAGTEYQAGELAQDVAAENLAKTRGANLESGIAVPTNQQETEVQKRGLAYRENNSPAAKLAKQQEFALKLEGVRKAARENLAVLNTSGRVDLLRYKTALAQSAEIQNDLRNMRASDDSTDPMVSAQIAALETELADIDRTLREVGDATRGPATGVGGMASPAPVDPNVRYNTAGDKATLINGKWVITPKGK